MRQFTDSEKKVLRLLYSLKRETTDINRFRAIDIIIKALDLRFVVHKNSEGIIVCHNSSANQQNTTINYNQLVDIIIFIDELVELKLIVKYDVYMDGDCNTYFNESHYNSKDKMSNEDLLLYNTSTITKHFEFVYNHLNCYFTKVVVIHPTTLLEDLVRNNFTSIEQRNFNKQMLWTRVSVIIASLAVIVSVISTMFSSDTKLNEDQFIRIENTIKEIKIEPAIPVDSICLDKSL